MLQIKSGKLFTREPEHRNELRGILYTNLRLGRDEPIETVAGRLLPTSTLHDARALIYEGVELIEAQPHGPGVLVSHGADPYLGELAAVVSFALNVTCTPDPDLTSRLTSGRRGLAVNDPPGRVVRRVFDEQVWCQDTDADHLVKFVAQLIGLERKSYRVAMRAIRTYVTGLHRLADDLELAYTLLVASVESLAQDFDGHRAGWKDFDQAKRTKIDAALCGADADTAERVRAALLDIEHVSLARRFRGFTLAHLQPSFFRDEASAQDNPVGRAELPDALKEAYQLRSKYIHDLQELPRLLTLESSYRETASIDGVTMLTFQGLARLARHVIAEFVRRQPKVETESYDYNLKRPGIVRVEFAPEYWVWQVEGLTASEGRSRLEGFLDQLTNHLHRLPDARVTDLRDMLAKVEEMLPTMKAGDRRPFVALHLLFNRFASPEVRMATFESVQNKYGSDLEAPSIEGMLAHLVVGAPPRWALLEHEECHQEYFQKRDRKSGLRVPRTLEAGLTLALAERQRAAGSPDRARELIAFAVENHPGHAPLRALEESFHPANQLNWREILLPAPKDT